jgi:hypothetical protein
MPKLNREYKKGKPHRDARLFVIVAEGEREDDYFDYFNERNSRIRVLTIRREQNTSAPKHFVSRLKKAEDSGDYTPEQTDIIWFVCDTDRWGSQLNDLKADCDERPNWNLAISNPCFEVWLHFHAGSVGLIKASCNELKTSLPKTRLGSFNASLYGQQIETAIFHAEKADTAPTSGFPETMQTKVYLLAKEMCALLGKTWNR